MISTCIPFPSSATGTENVTVVRGGKRTRRNALMNVTNVASRLSRQSTASKSSSTCKSPPRITILTNPERNWMRPLPLQDARPPPVCDGPPPRVTLLTNPERDWMRPLPPQDARPSPVCDAPLPRITILTNPERNWMRPLPREARPSPVCEAPPPRITILTNPARTRPLPSVQTTPLPTIRETPEPPRITILANPARKRSSPTSENSQNTQNASAPASAPAAAPKRVPTPISMLKKALAPSKLAGPARSSAFRISKAASEIAKGKRKPQVELFPKIVVHEPCGWDVWIDVDQPGTSYGELLDVPEVNGRGKLYAEDFARFYPKEHDAEQIARRLRKMVRSSNRQANARRKERARKRREVTFATPPTSTLSFPAIPAPARSTSITT